MICEPERASWEGRDGGALRLAPNRSVTEIGPVSMAEEAKRLRFAIAVFDETDRLLTTLSEFVGLGLGADDLWLAGKAESLQPRSALHSALRSKHYRLGTLLDGFVVIDELPSKAPLCGTTGPTFDILQKARWKDDVSCLESLLKGDIGAILLDHADRGATIVMANAATPELQDQCMRVLLRNSLHMVYSRECRHREI